MGFQTLPFVIIFITFSVVITAVVMIVLLRRMKKQGGLFKGNPGLPEHLCTGGEQTAMLGDIAYTTRFHAGSRNAPSRFTVSIDCPTECSFTVTKESGFDRFFKNLGITTEIQTGDPDFDAQYFIAAHNPRFAADYFADPGKREAVGAVFAAGFNTVKHDGKTMTASRSPARFDPSIDEAVIEDTVSRLSVLRRDFPETAADAFLYEAPGWKAKRAVVFAVAILAGVIGIPALVLGLVWYEPLDTFDAMLRSLTWSLPALLVFLVFALVMLRGRSSSHKELMIVLMISVLDFPAAGAGLKIFINGRLDRAEPEPHVVDVISKHTSTTDDSTSYHLVIESWREGRGSENITVSPGEYNRAAPGKSAVVVETKPGYLGFEWIVSQELRQSRDGPLKSAR